jgi:hypothetical protein
MVFTEIDKKTLQMLCTLAKLSEPDSTKMDAFIHVGQNLGVPKDETIEILHEWDEHDTMDLNSMEEKKLFVEDCFSFMETGYTPRKSERELYDQVVSNLGLNTRFSN